VPSKDNLNKWDVLLHFVCLILQQSQIWFGIENALDLFWHCCISRIVTPKLYQSKEFNKIDFLKCKTCPYLVSSFCRLWYLIVYFIILFQFSIQGKSLKPFWLLWWLKWNFYKDSIFGAKDLVDTMNVMVKLILQQLSLTYWFHLKFMSQGFLTLFL
jgi:hypothetical protein